MQMLCGMRLLGAGLSRGPWRAVNPKNTILQH